MTFEESIERLKERHEALTQSVEMLRDRTAETRELMDRMSRDSEREFAELRKLMSDTAQYINSLARIAEAHDHRIERLEEGNEQ